MKGRRLPVGPDSFDEGVGLDALIVGLQLVVLAVSLRTVMKLSEG